IFLSCERPRESWIIRSSVVIDIVGAQNAARKLLQQVVFFVGSAIRSNYADRCSAAAITNFFESPGDMIDRVLPRDRRELAALAQQWLGYTVGMMGKIEGIPALDAKEIAVDPALVAIVPTDDLHSSVGSTHTQSCLATIAAMGADGAHVVHLPRPRLV